MSIKDKITPGDWKTEQTATGRWKVVDRNGFCLMQAMSTHKQCQFDVKLAAHSKLMLDILERLNNVSASNEGAYSEAVELIRQDSIVLLKRLNESIS